MYVPPDHYESPKPHPCPLWRLLGAALVGLALLACAWVVPDRSVSPDPAMPQDARK